MEEKPGPLERPLSHSAKAWRLAVRATLGVVAVALLGSLFSYGLPGTMKATHAEPPAHYLPADTAGLVSVNLRELWAAPITQQLKKTGTVDYLAAHRVSGRLPVQLDFDNEKDVDQVRVVYGADSFTRPLCWALGRFNRDRFRIAPPGLQVLDEDKYPPFSFYCSVNGANRQQMTCATDGQAFVCCQDAQRVTDGVRDALAEHQPALREEGFRRVFGQVNRRQTVWFVADMAALGCLQSIPGDLDEKAVLTPFFAHAKTVYGGIQFGKDAEAVIYVEARDLIQADKFEQGINDLVALAEKREIENNPPASLRPLERCIAKADMKRNGKQFVLRFRLTPEMVK
jgi:hypothetical protein